jgi:CelD/BcsL family acetyltransferase involved in cellulose biosynthesis
MFQTGMDPDLRELEPGHMMVAASLRSALTGGYRTYDLLRGDEPYKALWGARPEPLRRLRFTAPVLSARCSDVAYAALVQAKRWLKQTWIRPAATESPG